MGDHHQSKRIVLVLVAFAIAGIANSAFAQSTAFTYQGRLQDSGVNANGNYDFQFKLYDAAILGTGTQFGGTVSMPNVQVAGGIFTVTLDFGACANCFNGASRFLEIAVKPTNGATFTTLGPRQPITSTPFAIRSASAGSADTANNASQLGGVAASNYLQSVSRTSSLTGSGTGSSPLDIAVPLHLTGTLNGPVISGFNDSGQGSGVYGLSTDDSDEYGGVLGEGPGDGVIGRGGRAGVFGFSSTGNGVYGNSASPSFAGVAGFNSTTGAAVSGLSQNGTAILGQSTNGFAGYFFGKSYFNGNVGIGTTSPTGKLQVNAGDIIFGNKWRTESTTINSPAVEGPPNLVGGLQFSGTGTLVNRVTPGVVGAVIGGGGFNGAIQFPSGGGYASGDYSNRVTDWFGLVGGGFANRAGNDNGSLDDAFFATVGGGAFNIAPASLATVGGGLDNNASGDYATIGGGAHNIASGKFASIPGGYTNSATADATFAAGNRAKANHFGTFVWGDNSTAADFASSGVNQFLIRASGGVGIGTNAPNAALDVLPSSGKDVMLGGGSSTGSEIKLSNSGTAHFSIYNSGNSKLTFANTSSVINANTPGTPLMVITSTGSVGIGTTSPSFILHVNGETRTNLLSIDNFVSNSGGPQMCANTSTNRVGLCSSSLRYKANVRTFRNGLDILNRLRPISFDWKEDGTHDIGLAAEEVNRVEPLLTYRNNKGQVEGVKYNQLSAVFINAFKQQQTQIEQQQKQLTTQAEQIQRQEQQAKQQQAQFAEQQREIDALKKLVCRTHTRAVACR